ncbi:hypothetical protein [Sulfuracidifex tepidarius]|uniref:Uncharacterized protein n=1 Tax=Sulfuracidifex tepidarius TaxID=1294262 RepID=A0A510E794_9CREN|nr:hypothetical protein [Sulfuracidifex tepidarius]BBG25304.1 hypothetical protein IC006_2639 [Sulfuracidifex tepidarius]BBG28098.1 hypothetical protein IC007_2653 [Sulfuracidifex tepidarius]
MSDIESTLAKLRNVSIGIFGASSFIALVMSILIFEGISFSINESYSTAGRVSIPYNGAPIIIASFLIFSSIFSIAMIIATEILITRLFKYSVATSFLSIIAVMSYLFLNYFRAASSPYALSIKPMIEITAPIIIVLDLLSIFIIYYIRKLERGIS